MTAENLAKALGGRRARDGWMAHCPAHDDRIPSLFIRTNGSGKILVRCYAGCEQKRVISALRSRGIWSSNSHPAYDHAVAPTKSLIPAERSRRALSIWNGACPAVGTLVTTYLLSRAIKIPAPPALRFHANLKHPSGKAWPAMVALVTSAVDGTPMGLHRTFLGFDGRNKAPVEPVKMMLGPCRGGVVRLGSTSSPLMIAEGIETALSIIQATGHCAWAALSTSGLRALELPADINDVVVLADGDEPGEAAALESARRLKTQARRIRIARPPLGFDFNDVLMGYASYAEQAT